MCVEWNALYFNDDVLPKLQFVLLNNVVRQQIILLVRGKFLLKVGDLRLIQRSCTLLLSLNLLCLIVERLPELRSFSSHQFQACLDWRIAICLTSYDSWIFLEILCDFLFFQITKLSFKDANIVNWFWNVLAQRRACSLCQAAEGFPSFGSITSPFHIQLQLVSFFRPLNSSVLKDFLNLKPATRRSLFYFSLKRPFFLSLLCLLGTLGQARPIAILSSLSFCNVNCVDALACKLGIGFGNFQVTLSFVELVR